MSKRRTDNGSISAALRKAIAESDIPLLTLQQATGVQRMSILRFLRGAQSLRLDKAEALADFLGVTGMAKTNRPAKGTKQARQAARTRKLREIARLADEALRALDNGNTQVARERLQTIKRRGDV